MMGTTQMRSAKWAVVAILIMIMNSKLVAADTEIDSKKPETTLEDSEQMLYPYSSSKYHPNEIIRPDPLDQFNKYRGGYNITNMHYWSSTIFTGVYGYAIGLLWLIAGFVYAICLLTATCCRSRAKMQQLNLRIPCRKPCYFIPLILTTILAILAIIASGVALEGNLRFYSGTKTIMSAIIKTADQASNTIYNATGPMRNIGANLEQQAMDSIDGVYGVESADIADAASFLAHTSDKLDYAATGIERHAQNNRDSVEKGLTILHILTTITISMNLVAVIALTVFGILRFRRALYMLVIFCWILTALCWLFFGAYFFLEKFSSDTCTALQDFQENPDNSSLSSILPCDEFLSARPALSDVGIGIYAIVDQVNTNISLMRSSSFPSLQYICNPFSGPPDFSYQPENCAADTIKIGDIPQVLKMFTCLDTSGTSCQEGTITPNVYNAIESYSTSIQSLLNAYPGMERLVDCQLVKEASSKILANHCKPMKRDAQTTWVAMLILSVVMVILVPVWASTGHHEQKHHLADCSIQPNNIEANNLDPEAAKATIEHQVK